MPRASTQRQRWDCPHFPSYFPKMDEASPGRLCRRDTRRCQRPCGKPRCHLPFVVERSENRGRVATRDVTNPPLTRHTKPYLCTVDVHAPLAANRSYFWFLTGPHSWNKLFLEPWPKSAGNCQGVKSRENNVKGSLEKGSVRAYAAVRHPLGSTQWTQAA